MRFNMLVALQVLLVSTLAFAEEEMSMAQVQKIMCDEENTEISDAVLACLGEMDLSSMMETAKECYPGLEGTSSDELKEYHCSQSPEDLENVLMNFLLDFFLHFLPFFFKMIIEE
ncbi:hypothetical protein AVEN_245182-1 [Araneus ventricosus]|uniref:Uncharacterized protein n=1 Tax=Araneus ventricosus TaxID=182803 RepID=A0A4Y2FSX6_ARAVE|nr:hypothetical protein AVEN_202739-1 [Araneus ventricosus]GBM44353.1 hypothetical protein AVEN_245182-1 [Araneus ventricosus]